MAIRIPWKIRFREDSKGDRPEKSGRKRKDRRGDSDSTVRKEDLDHLGRLHDNQR